MLAAFCISAQEHLNFQSREKPIWERELFYRDLTEGRRSLLRKHEKCDTAPLFEISAAVETFPLLKPSRTLFHYLLLYMFTLTGKCMHNQICKWRGGHKSSKCRKCFSSLGRRERTLRIWGGGGGFELWSHEKLGGWGRLSFDNFDHLKHPVFWRRWRWRRLVRITGGGDCLGGRRLSVTSDERTNLHSAFIHSHLIRQCMMVQNFYLPFLSCQIFISLASKL